MKNKKKKINKGFTPILILNNNKLKLMCGFTLIELVVVIAIVALISSLVIFNYSKFDASSSLENVSQDIALTIRKAQVSAIGVKGVSVGVSTKFPSFGVSFSLDLNSTSTVVGDEKSFIYFADLNTTGQNFGNKKYDYGTNCGTLSVGSECMNIIKIKTSDKISEICINDSCYNQSKSPKLDIIFSRPYPEAYFSFYEGGSAFTGSISNASIKIISSNNKEKQINIWNTGQISVK